MGVEDLVIPFTNKVYLDAIIIPAGLLVAGVYIVKPDYVLYAAAVTAALSAFKFKRMREWPSNGELTFDLGTLLTPLYLYVEPKKVLKPAEFQEFELTEKTVLSHNTAM